MEFDEKRVTEIFAGLAFIVLLILVVVLALRPTPSNFTTSNVIISESFNTEYHGGYYRDDFDSDCRHDRCYRRSDDRFDNDYRERYLRFDARSTHRVREIGFGQEYDEYIVYVENQDYVGGYFSVRFYFYDRYGNEDTEYMTKYVGPRKEVAFVYRNLDYGYRHRDWGYRVFTESKVRVN